MNFCCSVCCIVLNGRVQTKVLRHNRADKFCFWDESFLSVWADPYKVIFCSSLVMIAPGNFSMCFCSPRSPITTGIVSVFIPHNLIVPVSRFLCLGSFSVVFNEVFLSEATARSMSFQVLLLWSLITISGLLAAISLSVCICISQSIVPYLFSVTVAGSCSYHLSDTWML